jgi:hypothetical protein
MFTEGATRLDSTPFSNYLFHVYNIEREPEQVAIT